MSAEPVVHEPRKAVMDWLVDVFEQHAIDEQLELTRNPAKAQFHHEAGLYIIRALDVEERNPEPKGPCSCQECSRLYARAGA